MDQSIMEVEEEEDPLSVSPNDADETTMPLLLNGKNIVQKVSCWSNSFVKITKDTPGITSISGSSDVGSTPSSMIIRETPSNLVAKPTLKSTNGQQRLIVQQHQPTSSNIASTSGISYTQNLTSVRLQTSGNEVTVKNVASLLTSAVGNTNTTTTGSKIQSITRPFNKPVTFQVVRNVGGNFVQLKPSALGGNKSGAITLSPANVATKKILTTVGKDKMIRINETIDVTPKTTVSQSTSTIVTSNANRNNSIVLAKPGTMTPTKTNTIIGGNTSLKIVKASSNVIMTKPKAIVMQSTNGKYIVSTPSSNVIKLATKPITSNVSHLITATGSNSVTNTSTTANSNTPGKATTIQISGKSGLQYVRVLSNTKILPKGSVASVATAASTANTATSKTIITTSNIKNPIIDVKSSSSTSNTIQTTSIATKVGSSQIETTSVRAIMTTGSGTTTLSNTTNTPVKIITGAVTPKFLLQRIGGNNVIIASPTQGKLPTIASSTSGTKLVVSQASKVINENRKLGNVVGVVSTSGSTETTGAGHTQLTSKVQKTLVTLPNVKKMMTENEGKNLAKSVALLKLSPSVKGSSDGTRLQTLQFAVRKHKLPESNTITTATSDSKGGAKIPMLSNSTAIKDQSGDSTSIERMTFIRKVSDTSAQEKVETASTLTENKKPAVISYRTLTLPTSSSSNTLSTQSSAMDSMQTSISQQIDDNDSGNVSSHRGNNISDIGFSTPSGMHVQRRVNTNMLMTNKFMNTSGSTVQFKGKNLYSVLKPQVINDELQKTNRSQVSILKPKEEDMVSPASPSKLIIPKVEKNDNNNSNDNDNMNDNNITLILTVDNNVQKLQQVRKTSPTLLSSMNKNGGKTSYLSSITTANAKILGLNDNNRNNLDSTMRKTPKSWNIGNLDRKPPVLLNKTSLSSPQIPLNPELIPSDGLQSMGKIKIKVEPYDKMSMTPSSENDHKLIISSDLEDPLTTIKTKMSKSLSAELLASADALLSSENLQQITDELAPSDDPMAGGIRRKHCNCSKSQCLKLYCDCFANGEFCQDCTCKDCQNNLQYEDERQRAIKNCLGRNPSAFKPKIVTANDKNDTRLHHRGCNCKRSGCLKNYCECYEAKIPCSSNCKCVGCRNVEYRPDLDMDPIELNSILPGSANSNLTPGIATAMGVPKGRNTDKLSAANYRDTLPQSGNAKGRSGTDSKFNATGTGGNNSSSGQAAAKKRQCNFITQEVIDATIQCLITQADECEKNNLTASQTEKMVMEELGRCLVEIIDFSIRSSDSNFSHD